MLDATSLRTYRRRRKKKGQPYIIPPSYFRKKGIEPVKIKPEVEAKSTEVLSPNQQQATNTTDSISTKQITDSIVSENPKTISSQKNTLDSNKKRKTSGLSLNSIKKKKEHEESKVEKVIDPANLPKTSFTQDQMQAAWAEYGKMQDKKGERIIGSMFAMNIPTSKENEIHLELPNESMKIDLENAQAGLLQFLYKKLENYEIELIIKVNEAVSKKYAFTPQDKYDKLKEKNPLIDKLRSDFDLDI